MSWALRFLGVGNAQAIELGSASSVIECEGKPELMIDCGQEALTAYMEHYQTTPDAVFITHVHMDHVAGLERLFYKIYFDEANPPLGALQAAQQLGRNNFVNLMRSEERRVGKEC